MQKHDIGLIGLGKMGLGICTRLQHQGIQVTGYDMSESGRSAAAAVGSKVADTMSALIASLASPRILWVMVPSGEPTRSTIESLVPLLAHGDIIIDGGNSQFQEARDKAPSLLSHGIHLIDCGTSGGVHIAREGACLMVGGDKDAVSSCEYIFQSLACTGGYLYCGTSGSGHFTKMVHNAIEYGMMQSIAEGMHLIADSPYELPLASIARLWNNGSVIRSWLVTLTAEALTKDPTLSHVKGIVPASGEADWAVEEATRRGIPLTSTANSLEVRRQSFDSQNFATKLLAALRNEFGGHAIVN
jgi:6-phosphogluconate dehydrogenase